MLTRSGTAGTQRYAAIWTGDNDSAWEHILMAMPMCMNLGMSGISYIGADIGGFWGKGDGELLVRFAQLGAFFPFCRSHNSIDSPDQEPWVFGEPYESAYRVAIETRYRFLPHLYTLFREANRSGAPILRPLYYHFPQDEQALDVESEFLVGESLLSAPIYEQGATKRDVYLPPGLWYSYWDYQEYPGGGWTEIEAPLERWPLLVRSDSILVTGPLMQYTGQIATDPLTITCFMATDGQASYTLYEDDGSSQAYNNGKFAETTISCSVTSGPLHRGDRRVLRQLPPHPRLVRDHRPRRQPHARRAREGRPGESQGAFARVKQRCKKETVEMVHAYLKRLLLAPLLYQSTTLSPNSPIKRDSVPFTVSRYKTSAARVMPT